MKNLNFDSALGKAEVFGKIRKSIQEMGLRITAEDQDRPWGGFFVLDESQILVFKKYFFEEVELDEKQLKLKLSPKILVVCPAQRLSWQYHHRRAELWKLVYGKAEIARSASDEQNDPIAMEMNQVISLEKGERHRLVGANEWGIVAEIWMHTDPENPSNEEDIVRVSDDYARK